MMSFFGFDKIVKLMNIIKHNGGMIGSFFKLYRMDELKIGTLVGVDKFGNKYFENRSYFQGKNRWVEYSSAVGMDYDGSQIPAEWFGWMHHKTDILPTKVDMPKYSWIAEHTENLSGTSDQYVPYSTTRPKVEAWVPPKRNK